MVFDRAENPSLAFALRQRSKSMNESNQIDDHDQLLDRAHRGDSSAFERLFDRHRQRLRRFVDRRLDPRIRARVDASDIVQDTHVEAFRRFDQFYEKRPMPFPIWLLKNAYERILNVQRDHLVTARRSVAREQQLPDKSSMSIVRNLTAGEETPSQHLLHQEFAEGVRQLVARLPAVDQQVLLMRNVEGHSHEEIAHLLEISNAAARKRYGRALAKLEQLMLEARIVD